MKQSIRISKVEIFNTDRKPDRPTVLKSTSAGSYAT